MSMQGHHCRDVDQTEFGDRLNIFHTLNVWWIFLQSPGLNKHTQKLYWASTDTFYLGSQTCQQQITEHFDTTGRKKLLFKLCSPTVEIRRNLGQDLQKINYGFFVFVFNLELSYKPYNQGCSGNS